MSTADTDFGLQKAPCLSVKQPWAELILRGQKKIELRRWTTRYRGWVWLHTGVTPDAGAERHFGLTNLFRGGFVGSFELKDVVAFDALRWAEWRSMHLDEGEFQPGLLGWIIGRTARLKKPLPARGSLGLYPPAPDQIGALLGRPFEEADPGADNASPNDGI